MKIIFLIKPNKKNLIQAKQKENARIKKADNRDRMLPIFQERASTARENEKWVAVVSKFERKEFLT